MTKTTTETIDDNGRITKTTRTITEERSTTVGSSTSTSSFIGKFKAKFSHTEPIQKTITKTIQPSSSATVATNKLLELKLNNNFGDNKTISNKTKFNEFENECLNAHNEYRRKHKVSPLILDRSLCDYAQEWANVSLYRKFEKL